MLKQVFYYVLYFCCLYYGAYIPLEVWNNSLFLMLSPIVVPIFTVFFVIVSHKLYLFSAKHVFHRYVLENLAGSLASIYMVDIVKNAFYSHEISEFENLGFIFYILGIVIFQIINCIIAVSVYYIYRKE